MPASMNQKNKMITSVTTDNKYMVATVASSSSSGSLVAKAIAWWVAFMGYQSMVRALA